MSIVYSMIGMALVTVILVVVGRFLKHRRKAYFAGLSAAIAAYFAAILAEIIAGASVGEQTPVISPDLLFVVLMAPLVEETSRNWFIDRARPGVTQDWLFLGIGYGAFEGLGKLMDSVTVASRHGYDLALLLVPFVPFSMHVFLSVLACSLQRMNIRLFVILGVTLTLHSAHNAVFGVLLTNDTHPHPLFIALGYLALTRSILSHGRDTDPVTSAAPRANTAA